jgi:hypothetical protein
MPPPQDDALSHTRRLSSEAGTADLEWTLRLYTTPKEFHIQTGPFPFGLSNEMLQKYF